MNNIDKDKTINNFELLKLYFSKIKFYFNAKEDTNLKDSIKICQSLSENIFNSIAKDDSQSEILKFISNIYENIFIIDNLTYNETKDFIEIYIDCEENILKVRELIYEIKVFQEY